MPRKIRFPLKMKNGTEVRSLDELKENFDLESVLGYFTDGKLAVWLADRYYDDKADAVSALTSDMPDFKAKLCEILEVEYQAEEDLTDLEYIRKQREKYKLLAAYTDDKEILSNLDLVAINQDDLFDILDSSAEKVYLYGKKFEIPFGRKNMLYIGIKLPLVILKKGKDLGDYYGNGIKFKNVEFEEGINPYVPTGEKIFLEGKHKEAFPLIREAAENGNPRAMYLMARYYDSGYEVVKIDIKEQDKWIKEAYKYNEPFSSVSFASRFIDDKTEKERIYNEMAPVIKKLAEQGDANAQRNLGIMYRNGNGVTQDYVKAAEWYRKAAEQ